MLALLGMQLQTLGIVSRDAPATEVVKVTGMVSVLDWWKSGSCWLPVLKWNALHCLCVSKASIGNVYFFFLF